MLGSVTGCWPGPSACGWPWACCDTASAPPQALAAARHRRPSHSGSRGSFPRAAPLWGPAQTQQRWASGAHGASPLLGEAGPQALLTGEGPSTLFSLGVLLCLTPERGLHPRGAEPPRAGSPQPQACCGLGFRLEGPRPLCVWGTEGIKPEVGGSVDSVRLPGPGAWPRSGGTTLRDTPCAPQTP